MRALSERCFDFIRFCEGFSGHIYLCPGKQLTIGYGHVLSRQAQDIFKDGIYHDTALELLHTDICKAECAVLRQIKVSLTEGQFDALVSFTFNLGGGSLQRSTLRQKVNREEHNAVPEELMRWVWASGRKLKGLIHRRQVEGLMYKGFRCLP